MRDPLDMPQAASSPSDLPDQDSDILAFEIARLATDARDCAARRELMADMETVVADWPT
jgi:hypothetical protein